MVENPDINKNELEVKLFRAEMSYADDFTRKAFLFERLPHNWISMIIAENKQNENWENLKVFLRNEMKKIEEKEKEKIFKKKEEEKLKKLLQQKLTLKTEENVKKTLRMRRLLIFNRQSYSESLEDYAKALFKMESNHLEFEDLKSILASTCLRKFEKYMDWSQKMDEKSIFYLIRRADLRIKEDLKYKERKIKKYEKREFENPKKEEKEFDNKKFESKYSLLKNFNRNEKESNICNNSDKFVKNDKELNFCEKLKENFETIDKKESKPVILKQEDMKNEPYEGIEIFLNTIEGKMVKAKPNSFKGKKREKIEQEIDRMLKKGYIRESYSTWNNSVRPVEKPDGSIRICLNLMALNRIINKEEEKMPNMEEIIDNLYGNVFFSVIDLKDGFYQIKIREEDKHKTAFTINNKSYEFERMPMGYKNAPFIFQRIMNFELRKWIGKGVFVYLDDIIIYGKSEEEHDKILEEVLEKLNQKNLNVNIKKMQIKKKEINFLGQIIYGKEVKMPKEKIQKVLSIEKPKSKKDLEKFLGLINYHRRFIDNHSAATENLYELLKENKTMDDWTDVHQKQFENCKQQVGRGICRFLPDFDKDFILECDASNTGIAAVLKQIDESGMEKIIMPFSRKLTKHEKNWGITEKEFFAILEGLERFKEYLYGRKVKIISDHQALQWLQSKEDFGNPRINRWLERIMPYDFEIEYRQGKDMGIVDVLSREFQNEKVVKEIDHQEKEQKKKIKESHERIGHRGLESTLYEIKANYTTWPKQRKQIEDIINNCEICIRNKEKKSGGEIFVESSRKLEKMGLDIMESGEEYFLIGIDYFTRRAFGDLLVNKSAESIIMKLQKWFEKTGSPEEIIVDQGREFNSHKFDDFCSQNKIKKHNTAIEHSEGNGRVERLIRTLRTYFRKEEKRKVDNEKFQEILDKYNHTLNTAIQSSPMEAWQMEMEKTKIANQKTSKYASRFRKKKREEFIEKQIVAVQEFPRHKENTRKGATGEIVKKLQNDNYIVEIDGKEKKINHKFMTKLPSKVDF
ncbi:putative LTR retrotransposon [Pseudoloma neurophilia]|uniref:Putative LTR retrotransposon n=1 Tax=Pseudoloma neurophilia TaxID=146866 RepID=A0A0R0M1S3_9MICR|nr:putative LTR retrotransposon [Pseudoloma neurophilia]